MRRMFSRRYVLLTTSVLVVILIGCGKKTYPVVGLVVFEDEKPAVELSGGTVQFTSVNEPISAEGTIGPDGRFTLGTYKPGDGAIAGDHRVAVTPPTFSENIDKPAAMLIEPTLADGKTSTIIQTVEAKENQITIRLPRAKPR